MKSCARNEAIRVSIVGLGAMGRRHARVFSELAEKGGRFRVVGGFDLRGEAMAEAERAWGVAPLASEAEAIARADLVVLATPIQEHAAQVAAALDGGRHVLVEKPVCSTAAEAHALAARAARAQLQMFVGHSERFNPVVRVLARLLRGEQVLALELRRAGRQAHVDPAHDWGALVNLGVHDLDLAAHLTGGPVSLRDAVGARVAPGSRGEDLAHLLLTTADGAPAHVHVDRTAATKHRSVSLLTAHWAYEGDLLGHRLTRTSRATGARTDVPLPLDEPLVAQAIAIADALDGARPAEVALGADGARALALAEAAAARVRGHAALDRDAVGE